MYLILMLAQAYALECAALDADVCAATNHAVDLANLERGSTVLHDGAKSALQPLTIYGQLLDVAIEAEGNGCTVEGSMGGAYKNANFGGGWSDLDASQGGGVDGTLDRNTVTFIGTYDGDETGTLGTSFATFNSSGQLASDWSGGFYMGVWVRTSGKRGVFATLYGSCAGDPQEAFEDWYDGDLGAAGSGCSGGGATYYLDTDEDGYGDPGLSVSSCDGPVAGYVTDASDCNDEDPHSFPGAVELCDGAQNDCDDGSWTDDAGLATMIDRDTRTDVTATLAAGTSTTPVNFDVEGELQICEGIWYTKLDLGDDSGVRGVGSRDHIILDGAASGRVINARDDGDAFVQGVVIQNGSAGSHGGGIRAQGPDSFTLSDVIVRDNVSGNRGGGMHAQSLDLLTVTDVTFSGNTDNGDLYGGGANVYNIDEVFFTRVLATGNTGPAGGGLAFYSVDLTTLDTVTVTHNTASAPGGGISLVGGVLTGTHVTIANNTVTSAGGGLDVSGTQMTLSDSTISDNHANFGGALRTHGSGSATLTDVTIDNNTANTGGAFHLANNTSISLDSCTVSNNQQNSTGKAVVNLSTTNTTFTVIDTEFIGNTDYDVKANSLYTADSASFTCDQDGCTF